VRSAYIQLGCFPPLSSFIYKNLILCNLNMIYLDLHLFIYYSFYLFSDFCWICGFVSDSNLGEILSLYFFIYCSCSFFPYSCISIHYTYTTTFQLQICITVLLSSFFFSLLVLFHFVYIFGFFLLVYLVSFF
jgi:hypothetical protein